jgi:hypothetical protein
MGIMTAKQKQNTMAANLGAYIVGGLLALLAASLLAGAGQ